MQSSWNEFYNVPLRPSEMIDLLRDLLGASGTLAMPAFPIDQNPDKLFLVDKAPVYTGLLCEVFRRAPDVRKSIHLSSSVCAVGPNADFLVKDHHHTIMPWGKDSPFCRLAELNARMLGIGAGFSFMTCLHTVECPLYDEVPFFQRVFDGTIKYRWKRASGETSEHEYRRRIGDMRPQRLRRHFGPEICVDAKFEFEDTCRGRQAVYRARRHAWSPRHYDVYRAGSEAGAFCLFEGIDDLMVHVSEKLNSSDAIVGRVQDVFRAELDDEDLVIGPDTSQKNLKAWDSLAHIRLVSGIENAFDIQFNLTEIEQTTSVRQFVQLIQERSQ